MTEKALSNHLKLLFEKEFILEREKNCVNINMSAEEFNIWRKIGKQGKFRTWILCMNWVLWASARGISTEQCFMSFPGGPQ